MTNKKEKSENVKKSLYPEYTVFIKDLAKIVKDSQLSEIEFKENDVHIKIIKNKESVVQTHFAPQAPHSTTYTEQPQIAKAAELVAVEDKKISEVKDYSKHEGAVLSPMVGVVYTSPNPESEDFVRVGDSVKKGDTLLLIEAMKVFNTIKAHKDGKIAEIMIKPNQAVEYNQILIVIE